MPHTIIGRRRLLQLMGISTVTSLLPLPLTASEPVRKKNKFIYCLNTATIRGHQLGFIKELEIISKAGYTGVEIWMDTLDMYLQNGGTIPEIRSRLEDLNLTIENAIGFSEWIVDDASRRNKGIEQLKKEMDLLAQLGCKRTAAPPAGAVDKAGLDLKKAAERFRTILELGDQTGVVPHLELWGFSANLNRLSDVMYVAIESGHPKAKVLLDNFHLYKGGSNPEMLALVHPLSSEVFHMNDYTEISRDKITDADRILPGDGISPLKNILKSLIHPARPLVLSVEIFNKDYYKKDALEVAKLALKKMKDVTSDL